MVATLCQQSRIDKSHQLNIHWLLTSMGTYGTLLRAEEPACVELYCPAAHSAL